MITAMRRTTTENRQALRRFTQGKSGGPGDSNTQPA